MDDLNPRTLDAERRQLMGLAYRMMGTIADAEDAVQETYVRWYRLADDERDAIVNPGAWLTRVASRVCLDSLGSARARRGMVSGAGPRPWWIRPCSSRLPTTGAAPATRRS